MELIKKNIDDILDIKGKKKNFINNEPFSDKYKELAQKWSKLPMYKDKKSIEKFFKLLNKCNVILLISGTGRAGTTFLIKIFSFLGFDTGFNELNYKIKFLTLPILNISG